MLRALLHYALAVPVLSVFACEACPYIAGMGRATTAGILGLCFGAAFALRALALPRWLASAPPEGQAAAQARLDLSLFIGVALGMGAYNTITLGFPAGSVVRLGMGALTLGLFAATDLALARQRQVLRAAVDGDIELPSMSQRRTVGGKLSAFAVALVVLVTVDLAFLMLNDVLGLPGGPPPDVSGVALVIEITVVMVVVMAHAINLILSWTANLRLLLSAQTEVLEQVSGGALGGRVRVASDDELGQIAWHTNAMIDGLREREQVKRVLGKMVSPALARELLDHPDRALRLGGQRQEVVVMFADIRGFTTLSEQTPAHEVVALLNRYLSRVVTIVHAQDGVVDKFLGDGVMVVFPGAGAAARAVDAVLALQRALAEEFPELRVGVGLHQGEVIAGNIGSVDRLEYTHIGDVVNTAARLEGLSKELGYGLLISEAVYAGLGDAARGRAWASLGAQTLRGRSGSIEVRGLFPRAADT